MSSEATSSARSTRASAPAISATSFQRSSASVLITSAIETSHVYAYCASTAPIQAVQAKRAKFPDSVSLDALFFTSFAVRALIPSANSLAQIPDISKQYVLRALSDPWLESRRSSLACVAPLLQHHRHQDRLQAARLGPLPSPSSRTARDRRRKGRVGPGLPMTAVRSRCISLLSLLSSA